MNAVEVRNLEKRYPSFALRDVSFDIKAGRITGFIGRNGAGKTTTIKSMLNLVHPDGGTVSFFGKPFLIYLIVAFITLGVCESLHYFPGLERLNAFGTDDMALQLLLLAAGVAACLLITALSLRRACARFEKIDL